MALGSVPLLDGPTQLRDWMRRRGFCYSDAPDANLKFTEAAEYLNLDPSVVTKLANGTRRAGLKIAVHLEGRTGIPVEAWLSVDTDEPGELVTVGADNSNTDK